MSLTEMTFSPANGLRDKATYPRVPADEDAAREQVQGRLDEIKDYINDTLLPEVASKDEFDAHTADFTKFKGDSNDDISFVQALFVSTDTRSLTPTAWNTENKPTTLEIKDGETVLGTINITYNASGKITQLVLAAGGKTVTYTQTFDGTGKFTGRTKAVI
jgi:hypothetical protein